MSYTPVIPVTGYAGWAFLKKTLSKQTATYLKSPEIKRDEDYFRANIGKITTAADLVKDRRLLKVALGAYGLEADIDNKAFIQKVLEGGTRTADALANRLADKAYLKLSAVFGFGDSAVPATRLTDFPDKIMKAFEAHGFEAAVGNADSDLRLALNAQRELATLSTSKSSEDTKWFTILGNSALRQVFTKALGLPSSIGAIDLDQQLAAFKDKAAAQFGDGTVSQFTDATKVETVIRRFLVRSQVDQMASTTGPGAAALAMMQQTAANMRRR